MIGCQIHSSVRLKVVNYGAVSLSKKIFGVQWQLLRFSLQFFLNKMTLLDLFNVTYNYLNVAHQMSTCTPNVTLHTQDYLPHQIKCCTPNIMLHTKCFLAQLKFYCTPKVVTCTPECYITAVGRTPNVDLHHRQPKLTSGESEGLHGGRFTNLRLCMGKKITYISNA